MTDQQLAIRIVDLIIDDLTDRHGLEHEWRHIEEEIQEEIILKWRLLVRGVLHDR